MLDLEDSVDDTSRVSSSPAQRETTGASSTGQTSLTSASKTGKGTNSGQVSILDLIRKPPDQSFIEMTASQRRNMTGNLYGIMTGSTLGDMPRNNFGDNDVKLSPNSPFSLPTLKQSSGHVTKPKWRVNSVQKFTQTGSEISRVKKIVGVAVGINHSALLTGTVMGGCVYLVSKCIILSLDIA